MAEQQPVEFKVSVPGEVALQLAQFCKRSTFDTFLSFTEGHLSADERAKRAYQMIAGIEAVARGLADAGIAPR
ncbi:hypothetical protein Bpfe_031083 [Biomphalaria pfeifferi]|uniref:Uncharacterized protein n=1 Tax=Biomphalaria pfeifferi TaxID=112525 RepID=A0AAD8ANG8_BIOPF|nr:hypothetical protein Bpfe_031083 [Biomphalaria pfeifferi]